MSEGFQDRTAERDPDETRSEFASDIEGSLGGGRYTLVESIGEGGMGEVWVARQSEPVKRKVAIKLIKKGMDSRSVLMRFDQERQALALMDHPNIAKVLDGGLTDAGQPYFVMDLVVGRPLVKFCDEAKLGVRERLELFVPICQAVQHAHQKGVIHRDLKPANILVTLVDGKPTPKIIDFGVAKAVSGKLTDETLSTQLGAVVGTLEYMAPEQAGLTVADVDTRADVYSLGVILYELLTGLRPFDSKRLRHAALDELVRIIREEDPPSLSSRLSTDESLASAAAVRGVEPRRLLSLIKGELDWIVVRCLAKDRNRRYETANGVGRDVQRYLADEPIEARPVSKAYRLRKLLRKHRVAVVAMSVLFATLVAGIAGTSWQAYRASVAETDAKTQTEAAKASEALAGERLVQVDAEQKRTIEQKERAEKGEKAAATERDRAIANEGTAVAVRKFLQDLLNQGSPWHRAKAMRMDGLGGEPGKVNPSIREVLDRAARQLTQATLAADFAARPEVHTEILATVADAYQSLGEYDRALELLKTALALNQKLKSPNETTIILCRCRIAAACFRSQRIVEAASEAVEILAAIELNIAPSRPDGVVLASTDRFQVGVQQLDRVFKTLEEQFTDQPTFQSIHVSKLQEVALGVHLLRLSASIDRIAAALDARLGPNDSRAQALRIFNAFRAEALGRKNEAAQMFEASLQGLSKSVGPDSLWTFLPRINLARIHYDKGEHAQAAAHYERLLAQATARWGADHPHVASIQDQLGVSYSKMGRVAESLALLETAVRHKEMHLGPEHRDTLSTLSNLGGAYMIADKPEEAIRVYGKQRSIEAKKYGADHAESLLSAASLANALQTAGQVNKAIPIFEDAARAVEKGRFQHPHARLIVVNTWSAYERAEQFAKAEHWRRKWLAVVSQRGEQGSSAHARDLVGLGANLTRQEKWIDAERVMRECLAIVEKRHPQAFGTLYMQALLGKSLLAQKKYKEAEPLLLKSFEGMNAQAKTLSPRNASRIPEVIDCLIELYAATSNAPQEKSGVPSERSTRQQMWQSRGNEG